MNWKGSDREALYREKVTQNRLELGPIWKNITAEGQQARQKTLTVIRPE
jgi:hypothetical protein